MQLTFTVPGPDPALLVITDVNWPGDHVTIYDENAAHVSPICAILHWLACGVVQLLQCQAALCT